MCSPKARQSVRSVWDLDKKRKLVQLYAALLYNANLKGFIDGHIYSGPLKSVCVPGFNCYSCPGAVASCPLGSLQNALNASGHTAPWYVLGILALFGVVLGRTVCGFLCPLGLIQELLHKIPVPKIRKSRVTRALSYLKYVFLIVFVIIIPVWYGISKGIPLPGFCKYICPAGTLEGAVGLLQNQANSTSFYQLKLLFTQKWVIMLLIGLACAFCYRTFCRFICPLGAIYGFFNRFSLTGIRVDTDRCSGCGICVRKCGMDVKYPGDHECISCGECIRGCARNAISLKAGKITLAGPSGGKDTDQETDSGKRRLTGRIIRGIALSVLAFALLWFNRIGPAREKAVSAPAASGDTEPVSAAAPVSSPEPVSAEPSVSESTAEPVEETGTGSVEEPAANVSKEKTAVNASTGINEGDILPDFETELLDGTDFHLSDFRGRPVIINMWATTCAPCVEEIPYFEQIKENYPETEILAIHHWAGAKKAKAYVEEQGWTHLDFALDSKEKGLYPLLGASDAMPHTIVLNKEGVIIYTAQAPLTYEQMEALLLKAS